MSNIWLVDRMPQTTSLPGFEHETQKDWEQNLLMIDAEDPDNLLIDDKVQLFSCRYEYPCLYLQFGEMGEMQSIILTLGDT